MSGNKEKLNLDDLFKFTLRNTLLEKDQKEKVATNISSWRPSERIESSSSQGFIDDPYVPIELRDRQAGKEDRQVDAASNMLEDSPIGRLGSNWQTPISPEMQDQRDPNMTLEDWDRFLSLTPQPDDQERAHDIGTPSPTPTHAEDSMPKQQAPSTSNGAEGKETEPQEKIQSMPPSMPRIDTK